MLKIKKHSNGNTYLLAKSGHWIRNFCSSSFAVDINNLTSSSDYNLFLENEASNKRFNLATLDVEMVQFPYCIIVSDGYKFDEFHKIVEQLPEQVAVLSVNRSLAKWKANRKINYFIVNNPYPESLADFPRHRYFPPCVTSSKTFSPFVENYLKVGGAVYKYSPVQETKFRHADNERIMIDDYRNPICAAISIAYHFRAHKIFLLCCDESFEQERPSAEKLANGLYTYPQQIRAHEVVDANLYWLKNHEYFKIDIGHFSHGPDYDNAEYIALEEIPKFFT